MTSGPGEPVGPAPSSSRNDRTHRRRASGSGRGAACTRTKLEDAVHRIAQEELGIQNDIDRQLGVHAHVWDESDVVGNPSRQTVNVVYLAESSDPEIHLDDQHAEYRFLTEREPALHEYVRLYLDEYDLL